MSLDRTVNTIDQSAFGLKRAKQVSLLCTQIGLLIARGKKEKAAAMLSQGLYDLGGVYVKYLQLGSTLTPDFPGLTPELRAKVYDKVAHPDINVKAVLQAELGLAFDKQFTYVSSRPIAAGSFAGVYSAVHKDGTQLIVKVLRPNLQRQLKTDLRLLSLLTRSTQPFFRSDLVDLVAMYKEFKTSVWQETDYINEVKNAQSMAAMYKNNPNIVIPRSYPSLSTTRVIVQERLYGVPFSEILGLQLVGQQAIDYVRHMVDSDFSKQLEVFGVMQNLSVIHGPYVHGDIHPGNIFFLPGDKIGLIDFGVKLKSAKAPWSFFSVINSDHKLITSGGNSTRLDISEHATKVFRLYNEQVFMSMEKISSELERRGVNLDIVRELRGIIEKIVEPSLPQIRESCKKGHGVPTNMLLSYINHDNQFALRVDETMARLVRNQALFWGSLKQLELLSVMAPRIHKRVTDVINSKPHLLGQKPKEPTFSEASEIFFDWYSELVERNPLVFGPLFAKMKIKLNKYNLAD